MRKRKKYKFLLYCFEFVHNSKMKLHRNKIKRASEKVGLERLQFSKHVIAVRSRPSWWSVVMRFMSVIPSHVSLTGWEFPAV